MALLEEIEMMINLLGICGIIFTLIAYQSKKQIHLLRFRSANEIAFGLQYLLLGRLDAALTTGIVIIRNLVFNYQLKHRHSRNQSILIFAIVFSLIIFLTWSGPLCIVILIVRWLSTMACGSASPKRARQISLIAGILWAIYNLLIRSYTGFIAESISIVSILIAMIRYKEFCLIPRFKLKPVSWINKG